MAHRKSLRLLDGVEPQQQDQWTTSVKLPHAQSRQSCSNHFASGRDAAGKNRNPIRRLLPQKTRSAGAPKAITATARKLGCLIYRLIKTGQAYNELDLHTYELKYKDQILRSLRKRANTLGFDLVEVQKAA
jgi:transposase